MRNNDKPAKLLNFIRNFSLENGYAPSVREMLPVVEATSTCTVQYYINQLVEQGKLRRQPSKNRTIEVVEGSKELDSRILPSNMFKKVPLIGRVAAGEAILAEENFEDTIFLPNTLFGDGELFLLTIHGDSMIEVGIMDEDMVVVRKQNTANNGEIVIAMYDGRATCKRFFKMPDHIKLRPENYLYGDIIIKDCDVCEVLGKVVGVIRNNVDK